jgi:hypothetical protein
MVQKHQSGQVAFKAVMAERIEGDIVGHALHTPFKCSDEHCCRFRAAGVLG